MHRLKTEDSVPYDGGHMYLVRLPDKCSIPSWLIHAQIELDGKRVFVRMIDTSVRSGEHASNEIVGLVVSPVY